MEFNCKTSSEGVTNVGSGMRGILSKLRIGWGGLQAFIVMRIKPDTKNTLLKKRRMTRKKKGGS